MRVERRLTHGNTQQVSFNYLVQYSYKICLNCFLKKDFFWSSNNPRDGRVTHPGLSERESPVTAQMATPRRPAGGSLSSAGPPAAVSPLQGSACPQSCSRLLLHHRYFKPECNLRAFPLAAGPEGGLSL